MYRFYWDFFCFFGRIPQKIVGRAIRGVASLRPSGTPFGRPLLSLTHLFEL